MNKIIASGFCALVTLITATETSYGSSDLGTKSSRSEDHYISVQKERQEIPRLNVEKNAQWTALEAAQKRTSDAMEQVNAAFDAWQKDPNSAELEAAYEQASENHEKLAMAEKEASEAYFMTVSRTIKRIN